MNPGHTITTEAAPGRVQITVDGVPVDPAL